MLSYRPEIDGLRALAVYAVIIFHLELCFFSNYSLSGGFIGVDIFFVISGFLISSIILTEIENKKFTLLNFYNRRARRILPIFFLISIISSLLSFFFLLPGDLIEYSKSLLSSLYFSSNFFFWKTTGYFFSDNNLKPLIHTWSLSVEEQFYVIFPICLLICFRFFERLFIWLLILIFVISLIIAHIESSQGSSGSFFLLPTRAWELISGIFCTLFIKNRNHTSSMLIANSLSFFGLILVLGSIIFFNENFSHPGLITVIPVLGTMLILIFCNSATFVYKILANKILVFNGLISYSLYMWHQPLIAFSNYYQDKISLNFQISLLIIIFFLSVLSWKFIEQPVRQRGKVADKKYYSVLTILLTTLTLISVITIQKKGFIDKYSPKDHDLLLSKSQYGQYVSNNSNLLNKKQFNNTSKKKILLIGDSFSQDILNSFKENVSFKKIDFSWFGINSGCNRFYRDLKCFEKNLKHDKLLNNIIKYSDFILLSMSWSDKNFLDTKQLLSNEEFSYLKEKLVIVGSKSFGKISREERRSFLRLSESERKNLTFKINLELDISNNDIKSLFLNEIFIDLIDIFCDSEYYCNLFNKKIKLISYDGSHLTKQGATFLGKNLEQNEIIENRFLSD